MPVECPLFVDPPYISEAKGTGVPVGQRDAAVRSLRGSLGRIQWYKDDKGKTPFPLPPLRRRKLLGPGSTQA